MNPYISKHIYPGTSTCLSLSLSLSLSLTRTHTLYTILCHPPRVLSSLSYLPLEHLDGDPPRAPQQHTGECEGEEDEGEDTAEQERRRQYLKRKRRGREEDEKRTRRG